MNETVLASGMETTALMNDFNTLIRCSRTIQRGIFVEPAIVIALAFDFPGRPELVVSKQISEIFEFRPGNFGMS
jgi:hypothetical protein